MYYVIFCSLTQSFQEVIKVCCECYCIISIFNCHSIYTWIHLCNPMYVVCVCVRACVCVCVALHMYISIGECCAKGD